jgi:hypothetical protein
MKVVALLFAGILGATEPSYELASDLATRSAEARRELGAKAGLEPVEGVFLLVSPGGKPRGGGAAASAVTQRVLQAYFNGRFAKRPERAVSVYLFPDRAGYESYCQERWAQACGSPYGFYRPDERRIVMNIGTGLGTLTHELVHPIVESDFPGAPEWLNEGLASLFEAFTLPTSGEVHGVKNWRHPRLLRALGSAKERDAASLPHLLASSDAEFRGESEDLNYATARYFCQWLDQRGQLWPFYQRYRDTFEQDPSGELAFRAVTGKSISDANQEWVRWVKRL